MKDRDAYNEIIEELISMIPEAIPDYSTFTYNPTRKLIATNYKKISESKYNKNLADTFNFPIKTEEEFYVMTSCIINQKLIKNPARTNKCQHIECIEARNLFRYVLVLGKCPLCKELETSCLVIQKKNNPVGLDEIYIDRNLKEIFKIALNKHDENLGFPFSMIIFNKFNLKWRPFISNLSYKESDILLDNSFEKFSNIEKFDERNRNYIQILEMNKFIGIDTEFDKVLKEKVFRNEYDEENIKQKKMNK